MLFPNSIIFIFTKYCPLRTSRGNFDSFKTNLSIEYSFYRIIIINVFSEVLTISYRWEGTWVVCRKITVLYKIRPNHLLNPNEFTKSIRVPYEQNSCFCKDFKHHKLFVPQSSLNCEVSIQNVRTFSLALLQNQASPINQIRFFWRVL